MEPPLAREAVELAQAGRRGILSRKMRVMPTSRDKITLLMEMKMGSSIRLASNALEWQATRLVGQGVAGVGEFKENLAGLEREVEEEEGGEELGYRGILGLAM